MASDPVPDGAKPDSTKNDGQPWLPVVSSPPPQPPPQQPQPAPDKQRPVMMASLSAEMYIGPIPPPSIIEAWEKHVPGSAKRFLAMVEKQANHRMACEKEVVQNNNYRSKVGLWLGAGICLVMIVGGFIVIGLGHDWAGCTVLCGTVVGLGALFVYQHQHRLGEQEKKLKKIDNPPPAPSSEKHEE